MFLGAKYNPHLPKPSIYTLHLMYLSVFFLIYRGALFQCTTLNRKGVTCMNKSQNNTFLLQDVYCVYFLCIYILHTLSTLTPSCCQSTFIECR